MVPFKGMGEWNGKKSNPILFLFSGQNIDCIFLHKNEWKENETHIEDASIIPFPSHYLTSSSLPILRSQPSRNELLHWSSVPPYAVPVRCSRRLLWVIALKAAENPMNFKGLVFLLSLYWHRSSTRVLKAVCSLKPGHLSPGDVDVSHHCVVRNLARNWIIWTCN